MAKKNLRQKINKQLKEMPTFREVINDDIVVAQHSLDGIGWLQSIKVHKTYMISKRILRNIKLNSILDETN